MRAAIGRTTAALTLVLGMLSLAPVAGRWHWIVDLFAHFVPHYLAASVILLAASLWLRRIRLAMLAVLVMTWNGYLLAPMVLPSGAPGPVRGETVELLQFNVSQDNAVPLATIGYVQGLENPPDVIVLLETTPEWGALLGLLRPIYPTIAKMPRRDHFGMAVLSRLPGSDVEFRESGTFPVPMMILRARAGAQPFSLYAVHAPPPLGKRLSDARDLQLSTLAAEIAATEQDHVVVAGDLNTTVWSHSLKPLMTTAGLRNAQSGPGYVPTWAPPPLPRWLGIPIDLTLVSYGVRVTERFAGPWLASDHWPVHTRLHFR